MLPWQALTFLAAAAGLAPNAGASDITKLRRLMTDSRLISNISPCVVGGTNRINAAEWLRTAFHDAAAYDSGSGTGGIDGSIQYEFGFEDNAGVTFPSTIGLFKFFQQEGVSLADIVVLGSTVAVGSCGGPMVPFRTGRIDASAPSAKGFLPSPEGTTESHKQIFARMGFDHSEAITLVACGHTLGGVHASVHPDLTSEPHGSFDGTPANFDNQIAKQHFNKSSALSLNGPWDPAAPGRSSDTRLFNSDNNVTITRLASSNKAFSHSCGKVLGKMYDTAVPSSVRLSRPIKPFPISGSLRLSLHNGVYSTMRASFSIYDMASQWSSFNIKFTNRDGSPGDQSKMTVCDPHKLSIGKTIEVHDFAITDIPPTTGIGSFVAKLTMNDGSIFTDTEGEHIIHIDDTVIIDVGQAYTCTYSGEANQNAAGLNVTMVTLGPYNADDKVSVIVRTKSGAKLNLKATYRGARDAYYNFYNAFIPDLNAIDFLDFGAQVVKCDGSVHTDTQDYVYYQTGMLSQCMDGAETPPPAPECQDTLNRRVPADGRKRMD
ncbi:hypothetical protein CspHIS471_0700020 [Cutaneotrichosporon sp. HIS471]|nr:hypothetical protein CspHIS471_0700020 [Cutaneotrichosporon sp. HIS471]